jgi:hypothetical protein
MITPADFGAGHSDSVLPFGGKLTGVTPPSGPRGQKLLG